MAAGESGVDVTRELSIGVPLTVLSLSLLEFSCVVDETGRLNHVEQLEAVAYLYGLILCNYISLTLVLQ
jgi:hypothetical protein